MLIDKEDAFECQGSTTGHSSQLIFSKTEVFRRYIVLYFKLKCLVIMVTYPFKIIACTSGMEDFDLESSGGEFIQPSNDEAS